VFGEANNVSCFHAFKVEIGVNCHSFIHLFKHSFIKLNVMNESFIQYIFYIIYSVHLFVTNVIIHVCYTGGFY